MEPTGVIYEIMEHGHSIDLNVNEKKMPKNQTWRQFYAPRIAAMIAEMKAQGKSVKEMKKTLCDANPGQYGHMQKTWANEYMIQLGLSKRKGKNLFGQKLSNNKNQQKLF